MRKVRRNAFNTGVLDPLLAFRTDLEQRGTALKTGTNWMLMPHGGATRRPGLRYVRKLEDLGSPEDSGRVRRFRFNQETQYALHFRENFVDIYQGYSKITQIATPWDNADLPGVYARAQTADTMVVFSRPPAPTTDNANYVPRRLLRSVLRATDPIKTTALSHVVRVFHPDHAVLDGDTIGLSGLDAVGDVTAARLNTSHTVVAVEGSLGATPCSVDAGDANVVWCDLGVDLSLVTGPTPDRISLKGLATFGGVPADQLNRTQTVTGVSGTEFSFSVESDGTLAATGGGSAGTYKSESFYDIDIGGADADGDTGGGGDGRAWVLHSLKPNTERRVAFTNIPRFDFQDQYSPPPLKEIQILEFGGTWLSGDRYVLVIPAPPGRVLGRGAQGGQGGGIRTPELTWNGNEADTATIIQNEIDRYAVNGESICTVTWETGTTAPARYKFEFAQAVDYDPIQAVKYVSQAGTIEHGTGETEGGSREEDVVSDLRGWPRGGLFYQRRLWMFGLASRPSTIMGSVIEDFFNFDIGSALDAEAVDATGDFDTITYMIGERALLALTASSEVVLGGGDNEAVTPGNINLQTIGKWGAAEVAPVSVGGAPTYVDRTGRAIRQVGRAEGGGFDSRDISIFSQHLLTGPAAMDVWRNSFGDYLFVVNEDGTAAVLNINADQGVAGWTLWTTDGYFRDVAEVGDELFVIVERTIDGNTVYHMEAFDFDFHTDCGALGGNEGDPIIDGVQVLAYSNGSDNDIEGFDFLEGRTVQVVANDKTCDEVVVAAGVVAPKNGGVLVRPCSRIEVGLAIPLPTLEPMPGLPDEASGVVRALVDLYQARAVYINGFRLRDYKAGDIITEAASPLLTGLFPIELRGWGDSMTITITAPEPQPCTVRGLEMEVA